MATLTETAYYGRKVVRWAIIALIGYVILRISFTIFVRIIQQAFPRAPLIPNQAFGKLPALKFPETTASPSGQLEFTLQTVSGTIPEASNAAKVYFLPKNRSSLLSLSNAQTLVARTGFTSTPRQISPTVYRWIDLDAPFRTIELDIVNNHFELNYAYSHDPNLFTEKSLPSPLQAENDAEVFMQTLGLTTTDLDLVNPKVTFLKFDGSKLILASSQSQADAIQLDYFHKKYDGMQVLTDQPNAGTLTFIFSSSLNANKHILYVKYHYWPTDINTLGIYKLKTSAQAYQELLAGKGYLASFPPNQNQIKLTNVYLAYYDSREPQLFLQPIFVFEGDPNFQAFVSAVAPPWIEEK